MNAENGISLMREVLLIIWTLTMDLESGMFKRGAGFEVDAMVELMACMSLAGEQLKRLLKTKTVQGGIRHKDK